MGRSERGRVEAALTGLRFGWGPYPGRRALGCLRSRRWRFCHFAVARCGGWGGGWGEDSRTHEA